MEDAAMRKENCKEEHDKLPRDPLGGCSFLSSPHESSPMQLHCVETNITSSHEQSQTEQQYLPQKEFQKTGLSVQAPSLSSNDTVVHQIMTELSKAVSEEDSDDHYKIGT
jgi:hypothetical protein